MVPIFTIKRRQNWNQIDARAQMVPIIAGERGQNWNQIDAQAQMVPIDREPHIPAKRQAPENFLKKYQFLP